MDFIPQIQGNDTIKILLIANSVFLLISILNQNENTKGSTVSQKDNSSFNPLEIFTGIGIILQFGLLLIKIKTNNF